MSNYPAGVTDATIDDYFGPDEPEADDVIVPSDILSRWIEECREDGHEHHLLMHAWEYLKESGRLHSTGLAEVATARFIANGRDPRLDALGVPRIAFDLNAPLVPLVDTREDVEGRP